MKGQHFAIPVSDVTPFTLSAEDVISCRIAASIAGKPETQEQNFEGKLAQSIIGNLPIQQLTLANVTGTQATNSLMHF